MLLEPSEVIYSLRPPAALQLPLYLPVKAQTSCSRAYSSLGLVDCHKTTAVSTTMGTGSWHQANSGLASPSLDGGAPGCVLTLLNAAVAPTSAALTAWTASLGITLAPWFSRVWQVQGQRGSRCQTQCCQTTDDCRCMHSCASGQEVPPRRPSRCLPRSRAPAATPSSLASQGQGEWSTAKGEERWCQAPLCRASLCLAECPLMCALDHGLDRVER
mmetsp:Transcript_18805/g.53122  ORF Transcript_18805/g.53122 Transcript_18805/m.53122 type:complete len:216 (+) Transcript_18805:1198-1845(+)